MEKLEKQINDTIYGVITGDALGNPVQFMDRQEVKMNPVTDMTGGGVYKKPAGSWTDDSSMTLCLLDSLGSRDKIDYENIMNNFANWLFNNQYTPNCKAYDMGRTCTHAIFDFGHGINCLECGGKDEYSNGNGSLMRIAPLAFYIWREFGEDAMKNEAAYEVIHNVSSLTHGHPRSWLGCDIYIAMLLEMLKGTPKDRICFEALYKVTDYVEHKPELAEELLFYSRIFDMKFKDCPEDDIKSSGYIVDTLEAAIWCFLNTDSYEECVLKAVNLGDDADTVGAVAGGLAGLFYSMEDDNKKIPEKWCKMLINRDLIDELIGKLCRKYSD